MGNINIKIFVIVVTHNGSKTILESLTSLQKSKQEVQTVVIDNASTDNTRSIFRSFSDIKFFTLDKNIGFGRANNIGIKYALDHNADFVFLLNQDASVENDTVQKLVEVALKNPEFGIISPIHLNGEGLEIDPNVRNYLCKGNTNFLNDAYFNKLKPLYKIPFINAAAWLISSSCIKDVGYFDKLFFMYGEDNDYCHRVLQNGFKIGVATNAIVYHSRKINLPVKYGWEELKQKSNREAVFIIIRLIKTRKNFLKALIFWMIDHNSKILKILINRSWKEFIILILTGLNILRKIPEIIKHRKQIRSNS